MLTREGSCSWPRHGHDGHQVAKASEICSVGGVEREPVRDRGGGDHQVRDRYADVLSGATAGSVHEKGKLISQILPVDHRNLPWRAMTTARQAADLWLRSRGQPAQPLTSCVTDKRPGGLLQDLKWPLTWRTMGTAGFEPVTPRL
jgi:hypothetical protein